VKFGYRGIGSIVLICWESLIVISALDADERQRGSASQGTSKWETTFKVQVMISICSSQDLPKKNNDIQLPRGNEMTW
jgi:hypothetical protein